MRVYLLVKLNARGVRPVVKTATATERRVVEYDLYEPVPMRTAAPSALLQ